MIIKGTDIFLTRGDDVGLSFVVETASDVVISELKLTVKRKAYSSEELKQWGNTTPQITINPDGTKTQIFNLEFKATETDFPEFGEYRYDVQIKYTVGGGSSKTLTIIKPSIFGVMEEVNWG